MERMDEQEWSVNISKLIVDNDCQMAAKDINDWVRQTCRKNKINPPDVYGLIGRYHGRIFHIDNANIKLSNVKVTTHADLCSRHWTGQGCSDCDCDQIHICKYVIFGKCSRMGMDCKYGHNFGTPHNLEVLKKYGLNCFSPGELIILFKSKKREELPEVCEHYNKGPGCKFDKKCDNLHICYHYVLGDCTFGSQCKRSHNILDTQPANVLRNSGLDVQKNPLGILQKLRENMPQVVTEATDKQPNICMFYNKESGCRKTGTKCHAMHICRHYLIGDCTFGQRCKRSHNVYDSQPKSVLQKLGWDVARSPKEVLQELRNNMASSVDEERPTSDDDQSNNYGGARPKSSASMIQKQSTSPGKYSQADSEDDNSSPKICSFFLGSKCNYGAKCRNEHYKKPYLWQFSDKSKGKTVWIHFSQEDNDNIEMCYTDVANDDCDAQLESRRSSINILFDSMTYTFPSLGIKGQVRRIGTDSWGEAPLTRPFITKWLWYWKDEVNKWREYGKQISSSEPTAEFSSRDIEEKYVTDTPEIEFKAGSHAYKLDLKRMEQENKKYSTRRPVRRRPASIESLQDMEIAGSKMSRVDSKYQEIMFPNNWDTDAKSTNPGYQLVAVANTSRDGTRNKEYHDIESLFLKTMPSSRIRQLERIQNYDLWEEYARKKEKMNKQHPNGDVEEMRLFHGTRKEYLEAINQQGFDWRMTGLSSGTVFGKGSYFARDASYSTNYTDCNKMFVVKVLVGDYATGSSKMVRPPPKDPANPYTNLYDSCVNSLSDPQIFVIFDRAQSYPEYIIQYK